MGNWSPDSKQLKAVKYRSHRQESVSCSFCDLKSSGETASQKYSKGEWTISTHSMTIGWLKAKSDWDKCLFIIFLFFFILCSSTSTHTFFWSFPFKIPIHHEDLKDWNILIIITNLKVLINCLLHFWKNFFPLETLLLSILFSSRIWPCSLQLKYSHSILSPPDQKYSASKKYSMVIFNFFQWLILFLNLFFIYLRERHT